MSGMKKQPPELERILFQNEHDILSPLIRDVANYTQHEDCQLRGAIVQLLGKALRGALVRRHA